MQPIVVTPPQPIVAGAPSEDGKKLDELTAHVQGCGDEEKQALQMETRPPLGDRPSLANLAENLAKMHRAVRSAATSSSALPL